MVSSLGAEAKVRLNAIIFAVALVASGAAHAGERFPISNQWPEEVRFCAKLPGSNTWSDSVTIASGAIGYVELDPAQDYETGLWTSNDCYFHGEIINLSRLRSQGQRRPSRDFFLTLDGQWVSGAFKPFDGGAPSLDCTLWLGEPQLALDVPLAPRAKPTPPDPLTWRERIRRRREEQQGGARGPADEDYDEQLRAYEKEKSRYNAWRKIAATIASKSSGGAMPAAVPPAK